MSGKVGSVRGKTCIDAKLWWVSSRKPLKPSGRRGKELFVGVLAVEVKVAAEEGPLGMRNGGQCGLRRERLGWEV